MRATIISNNNVVISRKALDRIVLYLARLQQTMPQHCAGWNDIERLGNIACLALDPDDNEARDYLVKIGEIKE